MNALISDIQRFCMHDGPGIRTTVFLKSCPLHCAWCHNPETQKKTPQLLYTEKLCVGCGACQAVCPSGAHSLSESGHSIDRSKCLLCGKCAQVCPAAALEISGKSVRVEEILQTVLLDRAFYGSKGGITVSGGEPTAQPEALVSLLRLAKDENLHTLIETCGYCSQDVLSSVIPLTDEFFWDVKDTDPERHRRYTGVSNEQILSNLRFTDARLSGEQIIRLRCILVNGVNTEPDHYRRLAQIARSLSHCEGIELLPYHAMGGSKMVRLGYPDNGREEWIPSRDVLLEAAEIIASHGVPVINHP